MTALIGRTFLHPLFDYLLIGGGLSFVCTALVYQRQDPLIGWNPKALPLLILLSNSAHFAASTVRLYTKPGTFQQHPYLTMAFPLASIVLLASCIALPLQLGVHLQALYLTWSPYHYAAQAYGLAIIYCVRSGYSLTAVEKKIFRAICMLPFLLAFIGAPHAGLSWLAPSLHAVVPAMLRDVIISAVFLLPLAFFLYSYRRGPMPLIGPTRRTRQWRLVGRTRLPERLFLGDDIPRPAISCDRRHLPHQRPDRPARKSPRSPLPRRPLLPA